LLLPAVRFVDAVGATHPPEGDGDDEVGGDAALALAGGGEQQQADDKELEDVDCRAAVEEAEGADDCTTGGPRGECTTGDDTGEESVARAPGDASGDEDDADPFVSEGVAVARMLGREGG
jgi:hypothetical protein